MKPKYHIKWVQHSSNAVRTSFFHTNFIIQFTAKLRALSSITVLSITRVE